MTSIISRRQFTQGALAAGTLATLAPRARPAGQTTVSALGSLASAIAATRISTRSLPIRMPRSSHLRTSTSRTYRRRPRRPAGVVRCFPTTDTFSVKKMSTRSSSRRLTTGTPSCLWTPVATGRTFIAKNR